MKELKYIMILVMVIAFAAVSGCTNRNAAETTGGFDVYVDNIKFDDVKGSEVLVSFDITSMIAGKHECWVVLNLTKEGETAYSQEVYVGVLEGESGQSSERVALVGMPSGKTEVSIEPRCDREVGDKVDFYNAIGDEKLDEACGKAANAEDRIVCGLLVGKENINDYRQCFDGREEDAKLFCIAFLSNDFGICNNIQGYMFYKCLAFETEDEQYCEKSPDQNSRDLCFKEMARFRKDVAICDEVSDELLRMECKISSLNDETEEEEYSG